MLEYLAFLSFLEFAILNSFYLDKILKQKQVICLANIFLRKDVLCVLPTDYGKSLIFHLVPMMLFAKGKLTEGDFWKCRGSVPTADINTIVIVVSPLNSLMSDQVSRLCLCGIKHTRVEENIGDLNVDLRLCQEDKLRSGFYNIVFAHPEAFIASKYGRELLLTKTYQENVIAIVVDEAHCILDW